MIINVLKGSCMYPRVLGLFEKKIEGDYALLELAQHRFKEAGLGTEFYAETPLDLDRLLDFKPEPKTPSVVHLVRDINILKDEGRALVMDFALRFREQVFGIVIHDQTESVTRFDDYVSSLRTLDSQLQGIKGSPIVFIEYASGLEPNRFIEIFKKMSEIEKVSCCIDIGHIGLWQTRATYALKHPEKDVCAITPYDPELPGVIEDVQYAVSSALKTVLNAVRTLCSIGKPFHIHLHDGHPLSTFSVFGVSDHLSFTDIITIPFQYRDKYSVDLMFGPYGLSLIIGNALELISPDLISFTLEIHPKEGRLQLGDYAALFTHWKDKANAERMNFWLSVIIENQKLILNPDFAVGTVARHKNPKRNA